MDFSQFNLRIPQLSALAEIEKYLSDSSDDAKKQGCLIQMPTGSGKTGVIAMLRFLVDVNAENIIVLAPRVALRDQLFDRISDDFFSAIGYQANVPCRVLKIDDCNFSTSTARVKKKDPGPDGKPEYTQVAFKATGNIFISTIQKFSSDKKRHPTIFKLYTAHIKVIVIDEGHYEPALKWSDLIRELGCKRILLTATPYRNDFNDFVISKTYHYKYAYHEAVTDGYLRKIKFVPLGFDLHKIPLGIRYVRFVEKVLEEYQAVFQQPLDNNHSLPKIIIRCDDDSTIKKITRVFIDDYNIQVVALHEEFGGQSPYFKQIPPDHLTRIERVYIHQYKLLEGVDDPAFRFLGIYSKLSNDRSYIQQFGRIMRITPGFNETTAYVLDFPTNDFSEVWSRFLRYDEQTKSSFNPLVERFQSQMKEFNDVEYIDRHFRRRVDMEQLVFETDIQIPRSTNFIQVLTGFSMETLIEAVKIKLATDDNIFEMRRPDTRTIVFYSVIIANTPLLTDKYQLDSKARVIVIRRYGTIMSYSDSEGEVLMNEPALKLGKAISSVLLKKVFSELHSRTEKHLPNLTSIGWKNSFTGINTIRSRNISARSIGETTTYMDDKAQVMANARGVLRVLTEKKKKENGKTIKVIEEVRYSRYIGIANGKLSEYGKYVVLPKYLEWVDEMVVIMRGSSVSAKLFNRYARVSEKISKTDPKNILVDLEELQDDIYLNLSYFEDLGISGLEKEKASFEDMSYDIVKDAAGRFYFILNSDIWSLINEKKIELAAANKANAKIKKDNKLVLLTKEEFLKVFIEFDQEKKRYLLSTANEENFEDSLHIDNKEFKTLLEFLNRRQSFRVIPEAQNTIYIGGEFYNTFVEFGAKFDVDSFHQAKVLFGIDELKNPKMTEKGIAGVDHQGNSWEHDTLFHFIDSGGSGSDFSKYFQKPDIVVCDDMNTEIADFILCYLGQKSEKKVVFVHAKASPIFHPYSAKHIQEVCSQAIKNIRYLDMFNEEDPTIRINAWGKPWKWNGKKKKKSFEKRVKDRIRKGNSKKPLEIWETIKATKRDPNCYKEVWLVLGNLLSKNEFLNCLARSKPPYEAIQTSILLHAVIQAVASVECKLKIFCAK